MSSSGNPTPSDEEPVSPRPEGEPAAEAEGPGVLGSLPRSRPSVRSPRRAEAAPKRAATARGAKTTAGPAAETEPSGPREPAADEREKPHTGGPEADLERLARAGLSVAGGAAALGLRAAGRAAAALRDSVERR